jgi:hypothetical protein
MFLVDLTLDSGQHLQSTDLDELDQARSAAQTYSQQTMVELAMVINTRTGEVCYVERSPIALWRAA